MRGLGVDVTAIGTGGRRYARAFIEDEAVPFDVLLDETGTAAQLVELGSVSAGSLVQPGTYLGPLRSWRGGHRQHRTGSRPLQLGATLVMAPGDDVLYFERERFAGDHADLDDVFAVVSAWCQA